MILHNTRCCFTEDGRLEVYDSRLANKLNRELKIYEGGKHLFKPGEEAVFKILPNQTQLILQRFLTKK